MKQRNRKSIMEDLSKYCHLAKKDSFIEVCEWSNGEGLDITIDSKIISLTHGELTAINVLANYRGE